MSNLPDNLQRPDALLGRNLMGSHLSLRRVAIDTYRENLAYLHRDCPVYWTEDFQALSKVEIQANSRRILATLNVVDDTAIVACHELGLSEFARQACATVIGYTIGRADEVPHVFVEF